MPRLNQIIALEQGARAGAQAARDKALAELGNPAINGFTRTFRPRAVVDGEQPETRPEESQRVQVVGEKILADVAAALTRMFDVVLTKDMANLNAVADVRVDDETLLENVPTSYLLFLENQLGELRKVIKALPVLDPKEDWARDEVRGMHSAKPRVTLAEDRLPSVRRLAAATKEHPEQVAMIETKQVIGDWTVIKVSGAFEADRITELLRRLQKLKDAVLTAREEANTIAVTDRPGAGQRLAEFLLG